MQVPTGLLAQQVPEVLELRYSVYKSQRQSAYPGESVVLSCVIRGERLSWDYINTTKNIHAFTANDMIQSGFANPITTAQGSKFNFTGVLDYAVRSETGDGLPLCQSTMAVIPINTSDEVLKIICRADDGRMGQQIKSVIYNISTEPFFTCAGILHNSESDMDACWRIIT